MDFTLVLCLSILVHLGSCESLTKHPYGPLMCELLCQTLSGCTRFNFTWDLSCTVAVDTSHQSGMSTAMTVDPNTFISEMSAAMAVDTTSYPSKISTAMTGDSTTYQTETQPHRQHAPCLTSNKEAKNWAGLSYFPGDVLVEGSVDRGKCIHVGCKKMICCLKERAYIMPVSLHVGLMYIKGRRGYRSMYTAEERVERAWSKVGQKFHKKSKGDVAKEFDWVFWVATGLTYDQAKSKGILCKSKTIIGK